MARNLINRAKLFLQKFIKGLRKAEAVDLEGLEKFPPLNNVCGCN